MHKKLTLAMMLTSLLLAPLSPTVHAQDKKAQTSEEQTTTTEESRHLDQALRLEKRNHAALPGTMTRYLLDQGNNQVLPFDEKNSSYSNLDPIIPEEYLAVMHTPGKDLGKTPNTIENQGIVVAFEPLEDNTGSYSDFDKVNEVLARDGVPQVGMNGIRTFFGHYYDGPQTGAFAPLASRNYFEPGNEFTVTDAQGLSKGYRITAIVPIQTDQQYNYYYNEDSVPYLAYYGNGDDMAAFMTCRWDKVIGQMDFAIAYRIW